MARRAKRDPWLGARDHLTRTIPRPGIGVSGTIGGAVHRRSCGRCAIGRVDGRVAQWDRRPTRRDARRAPRARHALRGGAISERRTTDEDLLLAPLPILLAASSSPLYASAASSPRRSRCSASRGRAVRVRRRARRAVRAARGSPVRALAPTWHVVFERLPRSGNNVEHRPPERRGGGFGRREHGRARGAAAGGVHARGVHARRRRQERAGTPDVEAGGSFRKTGEAEEFAAPPGFELAALVASGALVAGRNEVVYDLGEGITAQAFVYLWHAHTPTVVFDVDGTVTVNDIVGHLGGFTDQPWVHAGICEFACALAARGYAVLFLTARPAARAGISRARARFLFEIAGAPRRAARAARAATPPCPRPPPPDRPAAEAQSTASRGTSCRWVRSSRRRTRRRCRRCARSSAARRASSRRGSSVRSPRASAAAADAKDGRAVRRLRQQGQGRVRVRGGGDRAAPHLPHRPRLDHPDLP